MGGGLTKCLLLGVKVALVYGLKNKPLTSYSNVLCLFYFLSKVDLDPQLTARPLTAQLMITREAKSECCILYMHFLTRHWETLAEKLN